LIFFPIILGAGKRVYADTGGKKPLRLLEARTVGNTLARVAYQLIPEG
jgi:hypothetical protein